MNAGRGEVVEELTGQRSEVDIGAGDIAGCRHGLAARAGVDQQRCPPADRVGVVAELHRSEQWMLGQCSVAAAEVVDVVGSLHEGHVWDGVDETAWGAKNSGFDQVGLAGPR
ncbi:hypothetical protein BJD99_00655 [Rhodococcus sp. 1163]|nr:hypothetical protein BJD99_00655 [Rhodococcus sp. 1163]